MGTMVLFASAHNQGNIALPWEPIGSINWYQDVLSRRLRVDEAARYVYNFVHSTVLEMEEGLRTLGKTSLKQLSAADQSPLGLLVDRYYGFAWNAARETGKDYAV